MIDCGHVFCVECLQTYYNGYITSGEVVEIRCLEFGCAKARAEAQPKRRRKPKVQVTPSELLQIPLEHEMVTRYVKLNRKAELESDKNTIYCPRKWCQGAAKSKKHPKPDGFEVIEADDESDSEETKAEDGKFKSEERLSICEDCDYAFCSRCLQGWHGEFARCTPPRVTTELSAEEKASLEYISLHTTPCPTCAVPAQKTHGCNHMICGKCQTHFCYLCSAWLMPDNPYKHYNDVKTGCFQRLWELEGGDGNDVDIGFAGGRLREAAADNAAQQMALEEQELEPEPQVAPGVAIPLGADADAHQAVNPVILAPLPAPPLLQREGPLVLRINQVPPAPIRQNGPARQEPRRLRPEEAAREQREQTRAQAVARAREEANQRWMQRFLVAAANDQEDEVESDDEGEAEDWRIPVELR
jgi:E3 ubiquitin-protein ligase RNF14